MVTIRSEICVPDDHTLATCTTMFDEYQFSIIVGNCQVSSYFATTYVTELVYNIGDSTLQGGSYVFSEDPICNYPETVTFENLPAFVTHNESTSDFTIPQTLDLALIGEYVVTIKSEICVPEDENSCTKLDASYDFKVIMQPCIVNTYTDTLRVGDISYNVGASSLGNIGKYIFDEDPSCNYPETVTFSNLPAFVTHNEGTSDFTIPQNSDLSLIGSYTVRIRSEISVPTDHTQ